MVTLMNRPVLQDSQVPKNGDIAHRHGYALCDNPFFHGDQEACDQWESDWLFRHNHTLPTASDAPGGRFRPSKFTRAPIHTYAPLRRMSK